MQIRQWHPTPALLSGKSHERRSLVGRSPWGCTESDTTKRLHFHFLPACIGGGNGNPLQCSCVENPRDGGAWWAAQSRTRLKQLSSSSSSSSDQALHGSPFLGMGPCLGASPAEPGRCGRGRGWCHPPLTCPLTAVSSHSLPEPVSSPEGNNNGAIIKYRVRVCAQKALNRWQLLSRLLL